MIRVPRRFATSRSPSAGLATGTFATLGRPFEEREPREKPEREEREHEEREKPRQEEGSHGSTQSATRRGQKEEEET
jgi:hypothetical protein